MSSDIPPNQPAICAGGRNAGTHCLSAIRKSHARRGPYGTLDDERREYVFPRPYTSLPWINYLGTRKHLGVISNAGVATPSIATRAPTASRPTGTTMSPSMRAVGTSTCGTTTARTNGPSRGSPRDATSKTMSADTPNATQSSHPPAAASRPESRISFPWMPI